jgi:2-dehydropantoate 2-reductase
MQNGVDNERAALRLFPHVFAVCVMCPAAHPRPGAVQAYSSPASGIFDIGRYPYGVDDIADTIAAAFGRSSIVSEARPDIMRWKYTKLLLNLVNAVDALFAHGGSASRVAALARDEGAACLRAAGIDFASTEEDAERRGDLLKARAIPGEERAGSSSRQSLAKGAGTIETDALNGEIVLLGRLHGVPTPINAALQVLAHQAATSRTPPGSYSADDFLRTFAG